MTMKVRASLFVYNESPQTNYSPTTIVEDDRMHQQHWLVALAFGSHFDSPVQAELEAGTNVLDSACGTLILLSLPFPLHHRFCNCKVLVSANWVLTRIFIMSNYH